MASLAPFIYFAPLTRQQQIVTAAYALLTAFIYVLLAYPTFATKSPQLVYVLLFGYGIASQLSLFSFCYRGLRNATFFAVWVGFSLVHLALFFKFHNSPFLQFPNGGSLIDSYPNTLLLLAVFQVCRFISLVEHKEELIIMYKGPTFTDERKPRTFDIICGLLLFVLPFFLMFGGPFL